MACDPLVPHTVPFVETVEPGRYTLRAWVAVLHKDGAEWQRRITALQLVIVDEPAVSWTMALIPGQDLAALDEDGYFGYGVDAGTGTLADRVAIEALSKWSYDRIDEAFISAQIPARPHRRGQGRNSRRAHRRERVCRRAGMGRWLLCDLRELDRRRKNLKLGHRLPRTPDRLAAPRSSCPGSGTPLPRSGESV